MEKNDIPAAVLNAPYKFIDHHKVLLELLLGRLSSHLREPSLPLIYNPLCVCLLEICLFETITLHTHIVTSGKLATRQSFQDLTW